MAESYILMIQARVLQWVGLGCLALGLALGYDPLTVTWRASLAAFISMIICGKLLHLALRQVADHILPAADKEAQAT
ncbi:MAG: hypothetical protein ACYTF0_06010 [Planctomycetota bacterium]|jgi:hypothetical protein